MDKDVFLLCPFCQTITDGEGTGDPTDSVTCKSCHKEFVASPSITYKNYDLNEDFILKFQGKLMYIPLEIKIG